LKDNKLRYSQELELLGKDLWLFSYEFLKFGDLEKDNRIFLKKIHRRPDLPRTGPIQRKPAQSICDARETAGSNGLHAGPIGQRPREAESVRSEHGRPI
jgi:hypothetical protein